MFYNTQKYRSIIIPSSIPENRYYSLPIHSHQKIKCKYQTPHKFSSTNHTRNDTLSFNTLLSKNKQTIHSKQTFTKKQTILSNKQSIKRKSSKNRSQSRYSKKPKKSMSKTKLNRRVQNAGRQEEDDVVKTNTQFYRSARGQPATSDVTFSFMTKISKIFDLVSQNEKLPLEVQSFFYKPLTKLRDKFRKDKKKRISETLIAFKNDCMLIYRSAAEKDINSFLRLNLPENNRWQFNQKQRNNCLQNERQLRQKYFKSLKMKSNQEKPDDIFQLKRIQDRLDAFLERSLKNRKVYI